MREALFAAIQEHEPWLSRFNRLEYCQSFKAYLERFAGVRFYFPGELGTIIPKRTGDFVIPAKDFTRVADFPGRSYSGSPCRTRNQRI